MAVFTYVAKDVRGATISGTYTDVSSASDLRDELNKMGYTLVKARRSRQPGKGNRRAGKIKKSEIATFAYKFSGMYSAGLPILRCLETLEQQADKPAMKDLIADVREHLGTGLSLNAAFARHKDVFSDFFIGMVEAGEVGGKLDETLAMSAGYLEKQAALKQKVSFAFIYPAIVTCGCLITVAALLIFIIPVFQDLYAKLHATLPWPTLALVAASSFLRHWWPAMIIAAGVLTLSTRKLTRISKIRDGWDNFKLKMPIFGKINQMLVVTHFIRTFAMLTSVGVSMLKSLEMACLVAQNQKMNEITAELQKAVMAGAPLAESMKKQDIFPPVIVQMASSGEEVGMLPEMLTKGADLLDKDIDRTISSLLVKLEPVLTLCLAIFVVFILLGAYLPMFDYMGHLK
jgi:type IV pilus assembly protein PilC